MKTRVFIIPDSHFPFHSAPAYKKIMKHILDLQPTHVVQIGDLLDQYVFSKYSRSLGVTPKNDVVRGLKIASEMWRQIQRDVPGVKCHQLMGNHDMRVCKRILEKLPELELFFSTREMYNFEGVEVLYSDRDFLTINGIIYCHGWLGKSIDHAKYFNKPTVHGHRHRPEIAIDNDWLWSMDVGFCADVKSLPLKYGPSKFTRWRMACGVVEDKTPRLILL